MNTLFTEKMGENTLFMWTVKKSVLRSFPEITANYQMLQFRHSPACLWNKFGVGSLSKNPPSLCTSFVRINRTLCIIPLFNTLQELPWGWPVPQHLWVDWLVCCTWEIVSPGLPCDTHRWAAGQTDSWTVPDGADSADPVQLLQKLIGQQFWNNKLIIHRRLL